MAVSSPPVEAPVRVTTERPRLILCHSSVDGPEHLGIEEVPTLLVVADKKVRRRIVAPNGCRELETELAPWLR